MVSAATHALSLRQKGLLAMLALLALIALLTALVLTYKRAAETDFDALVRMQAQVLALAQPGDEARQAIAQADARAQQMHQRGRAVAVTLAVSATLGVVLIGVVVALFFTQLSGDIEALRAEALAVVGGARAPITPPPRQDELGELGRALASLVQSLAAREAELELERRSAFHAEKMAALGALAAGVLHDIGNPIAAIDGIAHAMQEAHASGDCAPGQGLCDPRLILHETARLQLITRQIAQLATELAGAQPVPAQLVSLNDVVRSALLLLHFDPRLAGVRVGTELDPQLPALHGAPDQLLQLVMSLTTLAAQAALAPGRDGAQPMINIKTDVVGARVRLGVSDNRPAMDEPQMRQAFNADPLLDSAAPRSALAWQLALCQRIVQRLHGSLSLQPLPERGALVQVLLPLPGPEAPAPAALQEALA